MLRKLRNWLWGKPVVLVLVNVLSDTDIVALEEYYNVVEITEPNAVRVI